MKRQKEPNALLFAVGVILVIVGIAGFAPAGPFPHEDVRIGLMIWFLATATPTMLGVTLIWLATRPASEAE